MKTLLVVSMILLTSTSVFAQKMPPDKGTGYTVTGAILLPVGILQTLGGIGLLVKGNIDKANASLDYRHQNYTDWMSPTGSVLIGVGLTLASVGIVCLSVGSAKKQAYRQWLWKHAPQMYFSKSSLMIGNIFTF